MCVAVNRRKHVELLKVGEKLTGEVFFDQKTSKAIFEPFAKKKSLFIGRQVTSIIPRLFFIGRHASIPDSACSNTDHAIVALWRFEN